MVDLNWHYIVDCRKRKDLKYMLFTILLLGGSRWHLCICIFFSVKLLRLFWKQFECSVFRIHVWLRCVLVWISLSLSCLLSFLKPSIYAFCQIWRIFSHDFFEYISRPHSHLSLLPGCRWHKSLVLLEIPQVSEVLCSFFFPSVYFCLSLLKLPYETS